MDNFINAVPIIGIIILFFCGWEFLKWEKRNQVTKMTLVLEDNKLGELDDVQFNLFWKFANNNLPPKSELWEVIHNERSRRSVQQSDRGE